MWLMPSYGRPHAPAKMLSAPGGMPGDVVVLVNMDDPARNDYQLFSPFPVLMVPPGSRFADACRFAFDRLPQSKFYGIIDDDYWPVTPGWNDRMVEAAGDRFIAIANNKVNFPSLYTCRVMGGELARAIGTIAPGTMCHNYSDDAWARFAEDFGLLRPLDDVVVEHHHHLFRSDVEKDATYERGSGDITEDQARYAVWLNSDERRAQCRRVADLLGVAMTTLDLSKVHLGICVPMQDTSVDFVFHRSMQLTVDLCRERGIHTTIIERAGGSHVGKAREDVLWQAMHKGCSHVLFIDDDMGWDAKLVTRLLAADHDFACAVGVQKTEKASLCCNFFADPQEFHPVTKFIKIKDVGFAFVMLKREVIDRMCAAYPELQYYTGDEPPEWALFLDMIDTSTKTPGERLSEDFSFCRRWLKIGGEIWADPDAALIHAGRKEYTGRPADVFKFPTADAAE